MGNTCTEHGRKNVYNPAVTQTPNVAQQLILTCCCFSHQMVALQLQNCYYDWDTYLHRLPSLYANFLPAISHSYDWKIPLSKELMRYDLSYYFNMRILVHIQTNFCGTCLSHITCLILNLKYWLSKTMVCFCLPICIFRDQ